MACVTPRPCRCRSCATTDEVSLVDLWAVREVIDDTLCTFHPFHTETARALFALDDSLRFPSFVFIAEVGSLEGVPFVFSVVCVVHAFPLPMPSPPTFV